MRNAAFAVTLTLTLGMAFPLLGAKGEKKPKLGPAAAAAAKMVKDLTLGDEQKAKIDAITTEYDPKLADATKKTDVLTPEQKKAKEDAVKAAKAAGKKGKDVRQAADEAVKLTDTQKASQKEAKKQLKALQKELHEKLLAVLTPEQQAQVQPKPRKKKGN
ncbi:MAG: hypothetical protein ABSG86_19130 [Thermoguttaceae bacterium]|jgi:Spy/CpxP family protein refolding chaperone